MTWFYNSYSGELTSASGFDALAYQAAIHTGTGWHELNIPASDTEAQAAAAAAKLGGATPTTSLAKGLGQAASGATGSLLGLGGLHFSWLGADTFLGRALKIVIGGVLLLAGLLKMSGADKAAYGVAGQAAGKLPGV